VAQAEYLLLFLTYLMYSVYHIVSVCGLLTHVKFRW